MPWRNTRDPYKILVSEIMLQQTQVSRVLPKYKEFLKTFPTVQALAEADDETLLQTWKGLGYWRRARFLKRAAQEVTEKHNGTFPKTPEELQSLPGIGPYTAGALSCFAWNNPKAFIDTNIRRVYLHFFFPNKNEINDKDILKIAQKALWGKNPREWHYALFDYGATVLKDKTINKKSKHYSKQSAFKGSFRSFRTRLLRHILEKKKISTTEAEDFLIDLFRREEVDFNPKEILASLEKDGLVKRQGDYYTV